MVAKWEPGTRYEHGSVVEYHGSYYKIIQPHFSQSDWAPDIVPALWGKTENHGGQHQQPQQPQQHYQQPPQQQQQPQQPHGYQPPPLPHTNSANPNDQKVDISEDEKNKSWYDLDPERRKQVEVGGGLLAGVAAIGAGYYAYKKHEKNEEEEKQQQWALSNWLRDAQARSQQYYQHGPSGPAQWVLVSGTDIPRNAIPCGEEPKAGWKMFSCRAFHDGGIHLGKAAKEFGGGVLGYGNDEIKVPTYEVLVGDTNGLRWVQAHGRLNVNSLGARPVEGGRENNGQPLFVARAYYKNATHPGKCSEVLDGAYIPWGDNEKEVKDYEVLCYN